MKVAIYIRSSNDSHLVSCEAQEQQLVELAKSKDEEVYRVFKDQALSSTKDVRPAYEEMVALAKSKEKPFAKIYCLDTSRFGRDSHSTSVTLWQLRNLFGVEVIFADMPTNDSFHYDVFEGMMVNFAQFHSKSSKEKGLEGMRQNVRNGYRAGGKAPYGYKLDYEFFGKNKKGDTIKKSRLIPDPATSHLVTEYFERRARGESRKTIFVDFFNRDIPNPSGCKLWSEPTGRSWEENLLTYQGHTVFNRTNEKVRVDGKVVCFKGGKKFKDQSDWEIHHDTHPPLVSDEVAEIIKNMLHQKRRGFRFNTKRTYELSGMVKCSECGASYIGDRTIYRCNSKTKAGSPCTNQDVSAKKLENAIFSYIHHQILNLGNIDRLIELVEGKLSASNPETEDIQNRLRSLDNQVDKLIDLYQSNLIDKEKLSVKMEPLEKQKRATMETLNSINNMNILEKVSREEIRVIIENLDQTFLSADPKIRRQVAYALCEGITIMPKEKDGDRYIKVKGSFLPLTRVCVVTPRGLEPLFAA